MSVTGSQPLLAELAATNPCAVWQMASATERSAWHSKSEGWSREWLALSSRTLHKTLLWFRCCPCWADAHRLENSPHISSAVDWRVDRHEHAGDVKLASAPHLLHFTPRFKPSGPLSDEFAKLTFLSQQVICRIRLQVAEQHAVVLHLTALLVAWATGNSTRSP
eukprot:6288548-Amphidinium_carterae.1